MFFQVWSLGSAHEATYLRPRETGERESERKRVRTKRRTCVHCPFGNIHNRLWVHTRGLAANVTSRNMRGSVGKRCWILHPLKTVQKPFHQRLAMPYRALAWRSDTAKHHLFFPPLILFLYSKSPIAWDGRLNATCTKPKRTCHSSLNIMVLLENQRSLYILELPSFSFSKDTSQ